MGRLHDFVVALSFLAVSIDALAGAKQSRISKEDWTKTLKNLGFLRMSALKTLQNMGF